MNELIELVASPWNFLWVLLVFGFAPGLVLRLIVRIYPADHPRRRDLIADLRTRPWAERPLFVAEQLETAMTEGTCVRARATLHGWLNRRLEAWLATAEVLVAQLPLAEDGVVVSGTDCAIKYGEITMVYGNDKQTMAAFNKFVDHNPPDVREMLIWLEEYASDGSDPIDIK